MKTQVNFVYLEHAVMITLPDPNNPDEYGRYQAQISINGEYECNLYQPFLTTDDPNFWIVECFSLLVGYCSYGGLKFYSPPPPSFLVPVEPDLELDPDNIPF